MHLSNGILFNHESPRRGKTFVTRKITTAVARIHLGIDECVHLGNIDVMREWGHARVYVEGMWMMLQQDTSADYMLATGNAHTVRDFVKQAFAAIGTTIQWQGPKGTINEVGVDKNDPSNVLVRIDPRFFRPTEAELILGNPTKARKQLGWVAKTSFEDLIKEMVQADIQMAKGLIANTSVINN